MDHKKQHFVPSSYIEAWIDPAVPEKHASYVWVCSKDGTNSKKKSPKNILLRSDMYTIKKQDGSRDLSIEHYLSTLESEFIKIRNTKIIKKKPLTSFEKFRICEFAIALSFRTERTESHYKQQWENILNKMNRIERKEETDQQEAQYTLIAERNEFSSTHYYEDVKALAQSPLQNSLLMWIKGLTPILATLNLAIFNIDSNHNFITSDHPCVWHDPLNRFRPPIYQTVSLLSPGIEIFLPIGPKQSIYFSYNNLFKGYIPISSQSLIFIEPNEDMNTFAKKSINYVDECNRRIVLNCEHEFISNNDRINDLWLKDGIALTQDIEIPGNVLDLFRKY